MSDGAGTTTQEDPLRLTFCPRCDYSLEGLPEEGICPECGRPYDQSVAVIRCYGSDGFNGKGVPWGIVTTLIAFGLIFLTSPRAPPIIYIAIGFAVASLAVNWIDRFTSPRGGTWLLWIAKEGVGVQIDFDADSPVAIARKYLPAIYAIAYAVAMAVPMVLGNHWLAALILSLFVGGLMLLIQRAATPKHRVPATATRPSLFAWGQLSNYRLESVRSNRYRFRANHDSWVQRRQIIDVKIDATGEIADQIRTRVAALSGQTAHS